MAFTEFYCDASTGSNVNVGDNKTLATTTNGAYTRAGGAGGNDLFVAASGTPFAASVVGDFVSIYNDAAAVTTFIGRITAVNSSTSIDISLTAIAGTRPATVGTGKTATVGGMWKGPNGTNDFPLGATQSLSGTANLINVAGSPVRINLLNTATYSVTAAILTNTGVLTGCTVQGCTSVAGDLGKATIDGGTSGASYVTLTVAGTGPIDVLDIIVAHNGASGSASGFAVSNSTSSIRRCVATGMVGAGWSISNGRLWDCEAYSNNTSNTAALAGFLISTTSQLTNCISHHNTGSNSSGFYEAAGTAYNVYGCIAHSNGSHGFIMGGSNSLGTMLGCESYNNGGDGLNLQNSGNLGMTVRNCNFVKNTGWGINGSGAGNRAGAVENCGFGSGTMANGSGTTTSLKSMQESGSVTYASGVTPWSAPDTGDFRITLAAAKNAGKGTFTETQGGYAGTVGYPDIGSAQHQDLSTPTASDIATAVWAVASAGLDAVSTTAPAGVASTFREMVVQLWRRFFKGSAKTYSGSGAGSVKTFADDGTTPLTTQAFTETSGTNGTDQTMGASS